VALVLVLEQMEAQPGPNLCRPNNGFLCLMNLGTNPELAVAATYAKRLRVPRTAGLSFGLQRGEGRAASR
jgi:hypothetical protein